MREDRHRVVVTGMGILCAIGNHPAEVMDAVRAGKAGIAPITAYDAAEMKVKLAGEVKNPGFEQYIPAHDLRRMDRCMKFALSAAVQAMTSAGIDPVPEKKSPEDAAREYRERSRWGVLIGSGIGGISTIEENARRGMEKGYDRISPYMIPGCIINMTAGNIAIRYGLHGLCDSTVSACSSSANAIGDSFRQIADGYADLMVAGGAEAAITPLCMGGFTSMRALSTSDDPRRASIPFDRERNGFVMGEGGAVLVLEALEHAKARGAKIYGEITGYGAACDAFHITQPDPEGLGAALSMEMAMREAGIRPEEVDYINAHGTSTKMNDRCETAAIRRTLGDAAEHAAVSSTKSMTGHALGASGAIEAVITLLAMRNSFVPPTVGYQVPDPDCDLDYVPNVGREMEIRNALSNSFGFGGHDVTLAFRRWED